MRMVKRSLSFIGLFVMILIASGISAQELSDDNLFNNELKGQLQPVTHAEISTKMTGEIIAINVKDSQRFKNGDSLIEFDCGMERAELKKATAVHKADLARKSVNTRLDKLSSISELEYKMALYKADESAADIDAYQQKIEYCTIKAPYDGVVEEIARQPHEYVSKGDQILKILDDSTLEIELLVPSDWITRVKVGQEFFVHVAELDESRKASISTIGTKIDPVSQSIKIKGQINNESKELRPGMSVTANFE